MAQIIDLLPQAQFADAMNPLAEVDRYFHDPPGAALDEEFQSDQVSHRLDTSRLVELGAGEFEEAGQRAARPRQRASQETAGVEKATGSSRAAVRQSREANSAATSACGEAKGAGGGERRPMFGMI